MINYITEIIRHILTLYFGVFVTTAIIGIKNNKKNFLIVNCFCILDLLLHMICSMLKSSSHVLNAYPLLTHLPLLLLLIFIFKRSLLKSLLAVTTAYLCCQINNWISIVPESLGCAQWIIDLYCRHFRYLPCCLQIYCICPVRCFLKTGYRAYTILYNAVFLLYF